MLLQDFLEQSDVPIDGDGLRNGWNGPKPGEHDENYHDRREHPIIDDD